MLAALVIVFREVIEAGLIVGVMLAATRGIAGRGKWIALGLAGGLAGASLVAAFAGEIAMLFEGSGQETLNAGVLILAVAMLGWHNAWMASHGREMTAELNAVGRAVAAGQKSLAALAIVCGVAVLREGSEVVLFLYGVAAGGEASAMDILLGGLLGILCGGIVSTALYLGLVAIPLRHLFATLTTLITLLAAGLCAQAIGLLQQAGWVEIGTDPVWDTSAFLSEDGIPGRVLHTLTGYMDRPDGLELAAYLGVVIAMILLTRIVATVSAKSMAEGRAGARA